MEHTPQIGDIYAYTTDPCCCLEIVPHPAGGLGCLSLINDLNSWPTSFELVPAGKYQYLGGLGVKDRYQRLMQVNQWIRYGQTQNIPRTAEYLRAVKEWEQIARRDKGSRMLSTIYREYEQHRYFFQHLERWTENKK